MTNDVLYYEPGCSSSTGNSASTGNGDAGGCGSTTDPNSNKAQIWNYLTGQFKAAGYSDDQAQKAAAGVMGNMQQESGFNPAAQGSAATCSGGAGAYGINQWCLDRQTKVKNFTTSQGKIANCLGAQLQYMWSELSANSTLMGRLKGDDAAAAAHDFNRSPADGGFEGGADDGKRQTDAGQLYSQFTSGSNVPGASVAAAGTTAITDQQSTVAAENDAAINGGGNSGTCASTPDDGQCHNPLHAVTDKQNSRIDGGYDWGAASTSDSGDKGPVYAACPATITGVVQENSGSGWPGGAGVQSGAGGSVVYKVTAGKAEGLSIYVAEDCVPKVKQGDTVDTNTPICQFVNQGTALELGWAQDGNAKANYLPCTDYPKDGSSFASNTGLDFQKFMQSIGGSADTVATNVGGSPSKKSMDGCKPGGGAWPDWGGSSGSSAANA